MQSAIEMQSAFEMQSGRQARPDGEPSNGEPSISVKSCYRMDPGYR